MDASELKQNRRRWSDKLREAGWWLDEARKEAYRGDYAKSQKSTFMACALLDEACQHETTP